MRLLRWLDEPQDVPALAPLLPREVFYRVLTGQLGPRLRALTQTGSQTRRIAIAFMPPSAHAPAMAGGAPSHSSPH